MSETRTYGFNPIVAQAAVECPSCGYAEVAQKTAGEYQCSDCLEQFGPTEAIFHSAGDDPRDAGATVHEAY